MTSCTLCDAGVSAPHGCERERVAALRRKYEAKPPASKFWTWVARWLS